MSTTIDHLSYSHGRSTIQLLDDLRLSYAVVATGLILLGFFWNNLVGFNWRYVVLILSAFFAAEEEEIHRCVELAPNQ